MRAFPGACRKCEFMDGQEFPVSQGVSLLERASNARTVQGVRAAHPFLGEGVDPSGRQAVFVGTGKSRQAIATVSGAAFTDTFSSSQLVGASVMLSPFHPRCRCVPVPA